MKLKFITNHPQLSNPSLVQKVHRDLYGHYAVENKKFEKFKLAFYTGLGFYTKKLPEPNPDIEPFVQDLPLKPDLEEIFSRSRDNNQPSAHQELSAWAEHDAIHYITKLGFDIDSEIKVAKIEKYFNCGWLKYGIIYNNFGVEKYQNECYYEIPNFLTLELIMNTSDEIKNYMKRRTV
jgi:hypothetical protein